MTPDVEQACALLMLGFALWSCYRAARMSSCDRCWPSCAHDGYHRLEIIGAMAASALFLLAAVFFLVAEAMKP